MGNRHLATTLRARRSRFVLLAVVALAPVASAQPPSADRDPDSFINQQRAIEERLRAKFEVEPGGAQRSLFDWGGWYGSYVFLFDDGVESSRTMRRHDLRLWSRVSIDRGAHEIYARVRLSLLDFNSGDSFDGNDDDIEGPNLERGYYRFDLAKAVRASDRRSLDYNLTVTAGRDLVQFGSGLTLATPLDHVAVRAAYRGFELTVLAGKTVGSTQDFDLSRTATRTRRTFLGGQLRYAGLERHRPFVYALWQRDRNREQRPRLLQRFDYDSFHVGLGSAGELTKGLRYSAELVYQTGHSFGDGRFLGDDDIEALAAHAELEYLFPGARKARASLEYLFASGDSGRKTSPTNSAGGNRGDSLDTGFIGFGYRDTGLAFAPRYSNLHMWRVGGSYFPFPSHKVLGEFQVGTDAYLFYKHRRDGAVSDPSANVRSGYLGWELDQYANWRVTADLAWTARLGAFFPGKAFRDRTTRTFLLVGFTWSF